ncbi:MAG: DUF4870 domain-containing protein [Phycisphaerae bacterium]|nr:DUF4870 domain-containing protein [Phycisphaerae bacterium]
MDAPSPLGPTQQQRNWAMLAHLAGLAFLMPPFGNIIGPLLIWQIKRKELGEFVGASAREALNFQFSFTVMVMFVASLNILPIARVGSVSILGLFVLVLLNLYSCVVAAIRSNEGEIFRYPYAFRPF